MNTYRLFFESPHQHFIRIEMDLPPSGQQGTEVMLSKWRPGRYEMGPYVENVVDVRAETRSGKPLAVHKSAYNHWVVEASGSESAVLHYRYHAVAPDAGASYFDAHQVYVNGVNLFMVRPGAIGEPCEVLLDLPDSFQIACGMSQSGKRLFARDFHELVDCPFIASPTLQHHAFQVCGVTHHLWFQGVVKPDWGRIEHDFKRFGEAQVTLFGGFPVTEYHYLFQIHFKPFYHGVEHANSTVLAFGPGLKLMQPDLYVELLGLCSHELFHTWNVKAIRPADMVPYDYDRPNYSRLHYVTEGVTTYYGDLMLLKSGVWTLEEFLDVFNSSVLAKHYANNGRNHISLEEASFDSWLNGYKPGVPNRKISFYTKGALAAFILDYRIRKSTGNKRSLDTVIRSMYEEFGTGKGYTRQDYKRIAEHHAGEDLSDYFLDVIEGKGPLEEQLGEAAKYFGLELMQSRAGGNAEMRFGFVAEEQDRSVLVKQVHEGSPAARAGLVVGDELVSLQGLRVNAGNLEALLSHFKDEPSIQVNIFRADRLEQVELVKDSGYVTPKMVLLPANKLDEAQLKNRIAWMQVG